MNCSLKFALQIVSIVACCYAIAVALYLSVTYPVATYVTCDVIVLIFSIFLIIADIHVFEWIKYFSFVPTLWGRALLFFIMGFFIYNSYDTLSLVSAILFFILSMFFAITFAIVGLAAPPLTQLKERPEFSIALPDYYEKRDKPSKDGA